MHVDRALTPAVRACGRSRCDRARARGQRLPGSALPDGEREVMLPVDADELDVRPLRKAGVPLDPRAEPPQLLLLGLAPDDGMRISDRDGREVHALVAEVERLRLPHLDLADVDLDLPVRSDERDQLS